MQIAALTRYKNGALYLALKQTGLSIRELHRRTGISPGHLYDIFALRRVPVIEYQQKIQFALGEAGYFLNLEEAWPAGLKPVNLPGVVERVEDIPLPALDYAFHVHELAEENLNLDEMRSEMDQMFSAAELNDLDEKVLRMFFGVPPPPAPIEEIRKVLNLSELTRDSLVHSKVKYAMRRFLRKYSSRVTYGTHKMIADQMRKAIEEGLKSGLITVSE